MFYSSLSGMGLSSADALEARVDAGEAKSEADLVKHDIDRLLMITEALWTFLKKQHGYSDDDLVKAVSTIDARNHGDGTSVMEKCPSCGRMVSPHRKLCLYCGNPVPQTLFEA